MMLLKWAKSREDEFKAKGNNYGFMPEKTAKKGKSLPVIIGVKLQPASERTLVGSLMARLAD